MQDYQTEHYSSDIFTSEPVIYGTFWERFGAIFIDGLIFFIPALLAKFAPVIGGEFVLFIAKWLYCALMESGPGQGTLGRKAMGLRVTDINGGRISFGQATGRYFGKIISAAILLIGYFMMLWDDKNQTLHDKMAGALVVRR